MISSLISKTSRKVFYSSRPTRIAGKSIGLLAIHDSTAFQSKIGFAAIKQYSSTKVMADIKKIHTDKAFPGISSYFSRENVIANHLA
jgi:hypothetical protein